MCKKRLAVDADNNADCTSRMVPIVVPCRRSSEAGGSHFRALWTFVHAKDEQASSWR